jgi:hypothetical protein
MIYFIRYKNTKDFKMRILLTSLLFSISFNVLANVTIYRWVDENDVVHFSQNQPSTGSYTELTMDNAQTSNSEKDNSATSSTDSLLVNADKKEDSISKSKTSNTAEKCDEARKNLATLTDFNRVRFVNSDGETQILNEEEQKEQILINKERINLYCKSSSAK